MYFYVDSLIKLGVSFTVLLSCAIASDEMKEDEALKLEIGFDLTQDTNGAPSLRIRNFDGFSRKHNEDNRNLKRSVKEESSSESDEKDLTKEEEHKKINLREASELSEENESSESDEDRLSTRGPAADEFEPESNPRIHDRFRKGSDIE